MNYRAHFANAAKAEFIRRELHYYGIECSVLRSGCIYEGGLILEVPCRFRFLFVAFMIDYYVVWKWEE